MFFLEFSKCWCIFIESIFIFFAIFVFGYVLVCAAETFSFFLPIAIVIFMVLSILCSQFLKSLKFFRSYACHPIFPWLRSNYSTAGMLFTTFLKFIFLSRVLPLEFIDFASFYFYVLFRLHALIEVFWVTDQWWLTMTVCASGLICFRP